MKKLLSIVAGTMLVSTALTTTSCKIKQPIHLTKFDLKNLKIINIKVTKDAANPFKLQINVNNAYNKIRTAIFESYNSFGYKKQLKFSDFIYGSLKGLDKTENLKKSWAIQIINGNGVAMSKPDNVFRMTNIFSTPPTTKVLLANNALKVKITTTNKNVKEQSITIPIYLDKFVYSQANINQGSIIDSSKVNDFKNKVMDVSKLTGHSIVNTQTQYSEIITNLAKTPSTYQKAVSKKVITELNKQLIAQTKTLKNWGILNPEDFINSEQIDFLATDSPVIYKLTPALGSTPASVATWTTGTAAVNDEIYVRFSSLGLEHYIDNANAYLYLKIATVSQH